MQRNKTAMGGNVNRAYGVAGQALIWSL